MKTLFLVVAFALALTGCGTVTPNQVTAQAASYDGNAQNSGFVAPTDAGWIVTPHARDRYNTLLDYYANDLKPKESKDAGVSRAPDGNNFIIDRQHLVLFLKLEQWFKAGLKPAN